MSSVDERRLAAVVGAAVADAAAQPLHWIYDLPKLDNLIGSKEEIEFWTPSCNPYYCIDTGQQSCYGDQAFVLLESLVYCKGYNRQDHIQRLYKFFGPGSDYDNSTVDGYTWKGAIKKKYPVKGPWKHFSIKHFLKQVEKGNPDTGSPTDEQMDGVAKIAPIVALYAGQEDMLEKVEEAVRVTQDSDLTVAITLAAARILEKYILYGTRSQVLSEVVCDLRDANRLNPQDLDNAVAGHIREVLKYQQQSHRTTATDVFLNS